jgi:nucleotide-binding universal stress UspA family protein
MKTILVPTDFSPSSERALDFAVNIAKKTNAKIILANAYYIPTFDLEAPPQMLQRMYDQEDQEIKSKLQEICLKTSKNTSLEGIPLACEFIAELKLPVPEIYETATKNNVDLIIMGTEGKDNILGFFGSVTLDVIDRVHSPVMVVKENLKYKDFKKIVYAVEDLEKDITSITQLIPIAKLFNAEIDIIHIEKTKSKQVDALNAENSIVAIRKSNDYAKVKLRQVYAEEISKGLKDVLEQEPFDLIVLMKKERQWLENIFHKSVIKDFISEGKIPLLVIHKKNNQN